LKNLLEAVQVILDRFDQASGGIRVQAESPAATAGKGTVYAGIAYTHRSFLKAITSSLLGRPGIHLPSFQNTKITY
jgi:hypothetical protein